MKLEQMPRYPLLCGFTPLQRMENLEQALGCGPLYICLLYTSDAADE